MEKEDSGCRNFAITRERDMGHKDAGDAIHQKSGSNRAGQRPGSRHMATRGWHGRLAKRRYHPEEPCFV